MRSPSDQQKLIALVNMTSSHFEIWCFIGVCNFHIFEFFSFKIQFESVIQRTFLVSSSVYKSLLTWLDKKLRVPDLWDNQAIFKVLMLLDLISLMVVNKKVVENFVIYHILSAEQQSLLIPSCGAHWMSCAKSPHLFNVKLLRCDWVVLLWNK